MLDFGLLGPLQLVIDGVDTPLGTPKQRAVLAMLLINRNRAVSVDSLTDALWADSPPAGARASLHSYVSNLRKLLAVPDARSSLASAPPGYRLTVPEGHCDLDRFVAARSNAAQAAAANRFEAAARELTEALALWRGPVLDDLRSFTFAEAFATALAEDRLSAVTARAEAELVCGRAATLIGELEMLTAEHPYREPLWTQLISAYYVCERQSDALDAYQRLRSTLADDLGVDPGPSLRALHEKILRQEPLDIRRAAHTAAVGTVTVLEQRTAVSNAAAAGLLVGPDGRRYPLQAIATRIGRLPDNDIVLDDAMVSRHHAAVIGTGAGYVLSDLRSSNGVELAGSRVHGSTPLNDGDEFTICGHRFTFVVEDAGG
ncbi:BTAD domain-containing putative transcriptional regulator [Mycolicibacterium sp. F2034L]|uniref:BTAD domain-containing putative transcriptional regulator n=1 Tax=Mycolicibacterium sp. F2034L TaxID=2926422 RepID=UPI001FF14955|nr:BTAD domain-containing putative transcriptional regulator [Mycolicibacterium sp. F2034L]MCK0173604.1 FHA domain-containing protein [Mycolicibacterium sp. F2034L]